MPEICRFLGIVISMYFDEHKATISILSLNVAEGRLPARVRGLVEEWAELHQDELLEMWESHEFHKVAPLV